MEDEKALIYRVIKRDHEAFRELIERYKDMVFNVSFSILRDTQLSEDVSQEVFISLYKNIKKFKFRSSFSTWLYRIAVNKSKDYLRKKRIKMVSIDENLENSDLTYKDILKDKKDFISDLEKEEINKIIETSISLLDENYRIILTLKEIEGLSYKEIAEVLAISIENVKVMLYRARKKLKEAFRVESVRRGYEKV